MRSLNQFADHAEVFPDCKNLPSFFQTNLVDSARVVKGFENDPQAYIRIFYYQYLKLCFELQNVNYDLYIRKIQEIINNPAFNFIFYQHDDATIFNDIQAKSLIMQFFGILGEGHFNILKSLNRYPIMDTIFVHFFRSFLILTNITDSLDSYLNRDQLLDYLCKSFEVEVQIHGQCIKFVQTDIFVYQVHDAAVYMAYMDYEGENNQLQLNPQPTQVQPMNIKNEQSKVQQASDNFTSTTANNNLNINDRNKKALIQDSYIASQFIDFTSLTAQNDLTSKAKTVLKTSEVLNQSKQTSQKVLQLEIKTQTQYNQSKYIPKNNYSLTNESKALDPYVNQLIAKQTNSYSSYSSNPIYNEVLIQQPKPIQPVNAYKNFNNANTSSVNSSYQSSSNNIQTQNNYQNFQPIPTKDTNLYTGGIKNENQILNQQMSSTTKTNFQIPVLNPPYSGVNATISSSSYNNTTNFPNIASNLSTSYNQALPSPKNQSLDLNKDIYYNPNTVISNNPVRNPSSFSSNLETNFSANQLQNVSSGAGKKKPFGLNVSQQFTNDNVAKFMPEPFRSNLEAMKDRARRFRNSLSGYVK